MPAYLPELLRCVLASYSLQDLCAARVFVYKGSQLVYAIVDYDVKALLDSAVLLDFVCGEGLGHVDGRVAYDLWLILLVVGIPSAAWTREMNGSNSDSIQVIVCQQ